MIGAISLIVLASLNGQSVVLWLLSGILMTVAIAAFWYAPGIEARELVEQGRRLIERERFQDALPRLNRAIELAPHYVTAYIVRCAAFAGMSQLDLALQDAE